MPPDPDRGCSRVAAPRLSFPAGSICAKPGRVAERGPEDVDEYREPGRSRGPASSSLEYDVGEAPTSPIRVVVIDDTEDIRDVLHIALDRADDFEFVASAADGESGVAIAETHQPDLVLLDIAMPEMDGLQALQVIRHGCPRAVVIMLTGFAEQVAALSVVEHGAHGFIRKGSGVPEILDQMRDIWEIRLPRRDRPDDISRAEFARMRPRREATGNTRWA